MGQQNTIKHIGQGDDRVLSQACHEKLAAFLNDLSWIEGKNLLYIWEGWGTAISSTLH